MTLTRVNPTDFDEGPCNFEETVSTDRVFIEANTIPTTLDEIKRAHVIPVFLKDNECAISHSDFIESVMDVAASSYVGERLLRPSIRVSHPIKGRIPEAKDKPVSELQEWEKTVYYERMMFVIEIPSITDDIDGNPVSFTIGGVKSYSEDNLYGRKGADQSFKAFAGYKNHACCNLSIYSDGVAKDIKVKNLDQLRLAVSNMLMAYNPVEQVRRMRSLVDYHLTEQQFAKLIGRCRMYQYIPAKDRAGIEPLLFGDQQIGQVCRDYYRDRSFCRNENKEISLWKLYNLLTGIKSTYIDQYLERSVCASRLVEEIRDHLAGTRPSWYLN
jgi:hypothetical protein